MKKTALLILIALAGWGCVTLSPQYRLGTEAEMAKKWDEAIQFYEKASLENPKEPVYRLALERARLGASLYHLQQGRKLVALGQKEEAKGEYAKAIAYNPRDSAMAQEARLMTSDAPREPEPRREKIEFPIKLKIKEDVLQLKFPVETSLKSIFLALGKSAGISLVFDENFRDVPFATDLTNMSFEQALRSLCLASKNFSRIIDERTVIIVQDNPMKRMQYEVNCIKTFYLSNVTAQDMLGSLSQMLRSTAKAPTIIFDKNLNSVTIRDTPQVVELAEKLIRVWDKPKGEVVIDLEIMEVSRTRLRQLGVNFDQNTVGLKYGQSTTTTDTSGATTTSGWTALSGLDFSKIDNYTISLPTSFLQFLESDSDTKVIAQPRIRGVSDEEISHKVGQKIPIPRTTFSTFAAGGVNNVPITNFDQQDVGIEIKIKPSIHQEKDVTLTLDIKVTSIGGKGYADIPIINNREIKSVMRLKDGETNLIAGLLRDEERKSLKGIPGLKDLPVVGRLFGAEDMTRDQTDVILMITPYIIRNIPLTADDGKALWVDVETPATSTGAGGLLEDEIMDRTVDLRQAEMALRQRRLQDQGSNAVTLSPANFEVPPNREFRIAVNINSDQEIGNMSLALSYNPKLVNLKDVAEGGLSRQFGEKMPFLKNIDNNAGVCTLGFTSPSGKGLKGGGTLATLLFEPKVAGECLISVTNVSATGTAGVPVNLQPGQSRIVIR